MPCLLLTSVIKSGPNNVYPHFPYHQPAPSMSSGNQASVTSPAVRPFPYSGSYAVAVMDIERSIVHIEDPELRAVALAMRPVKCLVWVNKVRSYAPPSCVQLRPTHSRSSFANSMARLSNCPLPDFTTSQFQVNLIGLGLCPEDPEEGATSEMCLSIFPSIDHPSGPPHRTCLLLHELLPLVRDGRQASYQERRIYA